jgi:hypothetical protein
MATVKIRRAGSTNPYLKSADRQKSISAARRQACALSDAVGGGKGRHGGGASQRQTSFRASVHDFPGNAKIAIQPHGVEAYRSIQRKSIGTPHHNRSNAIVASSQKSIASAG